MNIKQPRWKEPLFTKAEINRAGNVIRENAAFEAERQAALEVIDNWRAAHAYPLHVFYMNLRNRFSSMPEVLVVERIKRLDSIVKKLQRESGMELYRMQDLGGCRVVFPSVEQVYLYSSKYQKSRIRHEAKTPKDYIKNPKPSGYRSLHLIYKFFTDTPEKEIFNKRTMLIELQFRTHLQHIWATAIEAMGLVTNQDLKAGEGDSAVIRFFALASSLFALKENCPVVPNTPADESALVAEIHSIDAEHHILDTLRAIRVAVESEVERIPDKKGYYILQLDYEQCRLDKWFYSPSDIDIANMLYDQLERKKGDKPLDIVLVRASSFSTVKAAYPNYFMDIGEFVDLIAEYLS